jgi:hypothetical protein
MATIKKHNITSEILAQIKKMKRQNKVNEIELGEIEMAARL